MLEQVVKGAAPDPGFLVLRLELGMLPLQHSVSGMLFQTLPPGHQVHLLGRLDQLLLLEHLHISQ